MVDKTKPKDLLIFSMLISFGALAVSGLLKFKKIRLFLPILPQDLLLREITAVHEASAIFLIILIVLHLLVQRQWFKRKIRFQRGHRRYYLFALGFLISLIMIGLYRRQIMVPGEKQGLATDFKTLSSVEVKEYQGEKLDSVKDFRENSIKGSQYLDRENYLLHIDGLVEKPQKLSHEQVLQQPRYRKVVTLHCVEGWQTKILWEGALIEDLLGLATPLPEANTVIFHAQDGYTSSLSLSEVRDNDLLLAYRMNGVELPPERGFPFQVVAENKWGYKWVKWVTKIELGDDPEYRGFYERSGYSVSGDLDKPKFDQ